MRNLTSAFVLGLRRRLRTEGGFTLIELMAALGIILVAMVALAYTATIGFTDIGFARQRQSANELADQSMEQIRALPFTTLAKGLDNTDLANSILPGPNFDPNIVKNGPCGAPLVYCYNGEQIPRGANANVVPLVPHRNTIVVGPTAYTVATYVTWYNNVTTANTFRLTVQVSWANPLRKGVLSKVTTQSIAFSASGCLSSATHPFSAPCQPFFFGNATHGDGHIDLTGNIDGINLTQASLLFTSAGSNAQIEQISAVQGLSNMSGVSLATNGNPATVSGNETFSSGADNDPAQPGADYNSVLANGNASQLSTNGNGNTLTLNGSGGDTGSTTSTTDASLSNPANPCPLAGSQNDLQPCGSSKTQQMNSMSMVLSPNGQVNMGDATLASLAAAPSAGSSYVKRILQNGFDGLIHSDVSRAMGTLTLGGLPSGIPSGKLPPGWQGYFIQLTSLTDAVSAETGTNTAAPATSLSGTLKYWTGAGYATYNLAPGASVNFPVATLDLSTKVSNVPIEVKIQGSPTADCNVWVLGCPRSGGTTTTQVIHSCAPACPNTRDSATAQSASPFLGEIHYQVWANGSLVADVIINVDLGTLLAQNIYQVAPSAT
jgi:prepilin-type N-terminal cleavage/methylation domain-containing protein